MKTSFFTDVEIIATPVTGFVNDFRFLRTIQAVHVLKERFDVVYHRCLCFISDQATMAQEELFNARYNFFNAKCNKAKCNNFLYRCLPDKFKSLYHPRCVADQTWSPQHIFCWLCYDK